ncbi:MAG: efflux RND transporter periplasmic adaptor subunit [Firmicutes bacterium]|nr:efflux RND transporter periplasmic adaptor subunit [Bacillota bacterium]MCM1401177.1 efflux RND transporter periplasmic adaptor subunit [Bacteroides sp.]MCM1477126.1 efflux RND transporter periplasmic adaptor subunit [Bacteroides sp.]
MKNISILSKIFLPVSVVAMSLTVASCHKEKAAPEQEVEPIDVSKAVTDSVTTYKKIPGSLHASSTVELVARVSGYLRSVNYKSGDIVTKGQLLFTIEDTRYRDAVREAQASLNSARSSHQYASSHYAAMEKALKSDAVSQMEVKQAKSALEQAAADIASAQAALETATTNLGYCRVYAPFTGRITAAGPSVGAYLNGEASPVTLATIYKDDVLEAWFDITDASFLKDFTDAKKKQTLALDSMPIQFTEALPHRYYADLRYLSPEIDPSTGTMQLRANIPNRFGELRTGMYVSVQFPTGVLPEAVLVKDASISTDQLGKYIYTVSDSNTVVYTHIDVGDVVDDSMRVVLSGVKEGTPYVTKALLKVRPGMKIKPVYQP